MPPFIVFETCPHHATPVKHHIFNCNNTNINCTVYKAWRLLFLLTSHCDYHHDILVIAANHSDCFLFFFYRCLSDISLLKFQMTHLDIRSQPIHSRQIYIRHLLQIGTETSLKYTTHSWHYKAFGIREDGLCGRR